MIPSNALHAAVKTWSAVAMLNGQPVPLADDLPRRSLGFGQARGACTLATLAFPDLPAGCPAEVTLVLSVNGTTYDTTFFVGRMEARPIRDLPLSFEVGLVDSLARVETPIGEDLSWSGRSVPDAVRDLLGRAGVAETQIGPIFNPGSDYDLGVVDAIIIPGTRTVADVLTELLTYSGCGLIVLPNGTLTVLDAPGLPVAPTAQTPIYAFGATGGEFGFISSNRTVAGVEGAVTSFTAKGPRLSTKRIADATFRLSGVGTGKELTETYPYLQTDACAQAIARREIVRRNRAATEVDVSAPLNPNLRPGDTILFRHPELGFPTNTPAVIIGTTTSGEEMTITLSVGARHATGDESLIPPPVADFTLRYEVQPVKLAGVMAVNTVVEAVDTSHDPSGLGITSRSWHAACAGSVKPEPESVSWSYDPTKSDRANPIPNPVFIFPTLDGATIELTVESESGEGATTTKPVAPPPGEVFTRVISVAAGAQGWRILTGAAGWSSFIQTAQCTAVPPINDSGPLLAGFADGQIYLTEDTLATPPTKLATLSGGVVGCLWVNEGNSQEVLAGVGSTLYRSQDGGAGWVALAGFGAPVEYCESSGANPNEIRVCVGPRFAISLDGTSFTTLFEGPSGSRCRKVASAPWGHLVVWSGVETLDDAWKFEEGHAIDWSAVPTDSLPVGLSSVTPLQYQAGYLAVSGGAKDIVRDGLFGQLAYLANQGTSTIYRLTPGAGGFVAELQSVALEPAPMKVTLSSTQTFPIDACDPLRIGYGQASERPEPAEIVLLPSNLQGPGDMLWHYQQLVGWVPKALPIPGAAWKGIDINPANHRHWLIWDAERVYVTQTAGRSWVQVYFPVTIDAVNSITSVTAAFTGLRNEWVVAVQYYHRFGTKGGSQARYIRGRNLANEDVRAYGNMVYGSPGMPNSGPFVGLTRLVRGVPGHLWAYGTDVPAEWLNGQGPPTLIYTLDASTLTPNRVGESPYQPGVRYHPGSMEGIAVWDSNIAYTPNYQSDLPLGTVAAGTAVAVCDVTPLHARVFVGGREGIVEIQDFGVSPFPAVVAAGGQTIATIATGSRRRGVAALTAARGIPGAPAYRVYGFNGVEWAYVDAPSALTLVAPVIGVPEP